MSDADYDELHDFAMKLGLRRLSFQGDHYDVPSALRAEAIEAGAVAVPSRVLVARLRAAGLRRRGAGRPWTRVWWLAAPSVFDRPALDAALVHLEPWSVARVRRVFGTVSEVGPLLRGQGAHALRRPTGDGATEIALAVDLPPSVERCLDLTERGDLAEVHLARRADRVSVELLVRQT